MSQGFKGVSVEKHPWHCKELQFASFSGLVADFEVSFDMVVFVLSFFIFSFFCSVFKGKFSDLIGQKEMEIIGRIFPLDDFQTNSFYDKF
jgi:hypothetical protein